MKKLFILMFVFVSLSLSAQIGSGAATSFNYGIKLPNATKSDTLSAQTRIPILKYNDNNLMNIYVPLEDLGAYVSGILWGNITGTLSDQTDLQAALDLKATLASPTFTGTVSGITKSMVGLGNVDNTSDLNKPISTATQTALDLKANDADVVHLSGTETITGQKDFTSFIGLTTTTPGAGFGIQSSLTGSGSSYFGTNDGTGQIIRLQLNSATGRGIIVDGTTTSSGNLFVGQNNAANTFTVSKLGNITGNSFIKTGGTSSQFLKADGSVDGNSYLLSSIYTAADVLSKLLTVDGSGSGLDADLLEGSESKYYSKTKFDTKSILNYKQYFDNNIKGYVGDIDLVTRLNLVNNSETYTSGNLFIASTGMTIDPTDTVEFNGIVLERIKGDNYFSNLNFRQTIFTVGKRYLVSFYAVSPTRDYFIWNNTQNTSQAGHSARYVDNNIRRISFVGEATSTSNLDIINDPTIEMGSGTGGFPTFGVSKVSPNETDLYIGGFQVEEISDTYKYGIAWIGDSTIAANSGTIDSYASTSVTRWVEALMNVICFNRAVGGERLDQMDARWATDITPLTVNSRYVVIQGGLNDISQGRTLIDMQTSINSMVSKAVTDGLIPVILTCTPSNAFDTTKNTLRDDLNNWIKSTFENAIDINSVIDIDDTIVQGYPSSDYQSDGIHYGVELRKAIADFIINHPVWNFQKPSDYQKTTTVFDAKSIQVGDVTANSFIKSGGTNQQALLADGTTKTVPKVYTALVSQSGTDAPTATVLENTLGGTVTFTYNSAGVYFLNLTGAFVSAKTWFTGQLDKGAGDNSYLNMSRIDNDQIRLTTNTNSGAGGGLTNGILDNSPIKIEVYP